MHILVDCGCVFQIREKTEKKRACCKPKKQGATNGNKRRRSSYEDQTKKGSWQDGENRRGDSR